MTTPETIHRPTRPRFRGDYSLTAIESGWTDDTRRPIDNAHSAAMFYALAVPGVRVSVVDGRTGEVVRTYLAEK